MRARARALRVAREFFDARDVLEIETPALSSHGVTDPHIDGIKTRLEGLPDRELHLQTSPEYSMKRLLAAGSPDIYQVCRVFRDGELGRRHRPEFTMVEWYRRGFSLSDMIDETCRFIAALFAGSASVSLPSAANRLRYDEAFAAATGLDPLVADVEKLRGRARELVPGLTESTVAGLGDDRTAWLDLLMGYAVIPNLPANSLAVLHHYPAEQAALARLDPDDVRFAERFEISYDGIELANGYHELADAEEQRRRFDGDRHRRAALGRPDVAADPRLLAALEHGLPDCCGVAVGLDRVLMCALGMDSIDDVISFPI
ncbi:MAG: EF-P lysine aminoacylase GenX [Gammaproteobacteria bacterium]|nr:EF-P lysine aminoacylase GenX [Gammaproteobacteria bacterium]